MLTTGSLDLRPKRWVPYIFRIRFDALDLTAATFVMEVRAYKDAEGAPLIALANSVSPVQGISVSVITTGGVPASTVEIRISEATLEALQPFAVTSGVPNRTPASDLALYYDLMITPAGGSKDVYLTGKFIILAGVTKNV